MCSIPCVLRPRYPYEVLMRSVLKHLVEAATCEFLFTHDFFKARGLDTFNRSASLTVP